MNEYDPNKHHRRSIRLKEWDYRWPGLYFVTICTHQRQNLFTNQPFHDIAAHALQDIPAQKHAQHVELDDWVVMPNHVHLILIFMQIAAQANMSIPIGNFENALAGSLGVVVGLLRTDHPQRTGITGNPGIYSQQPGTLGGRPG